jgi:murein DD-endopeptidase MepM/ murein hydrolase activator NlpD
VIYTKDDYIFSGQSTYFLDKANKVEVLHDDGTYAVYAHLLQSTIGVTIGDSVAVGAELGKSGSSGFSTGPHLHFVIRRNIGFKTVSVPFRFSDNNATPFTPTTGYYIQPNR